MVITTKSTLLLRDLDLLMELNKVTDICVSISVSALDEIIREQIEPFAPPTAERLEMLRIISEANIRTNILMMPIIPYLTDNIENLDEIFRLSQENGAKSIIPQLLHLRGNTKNIFFEYAKNYFPGLVEKLSPIYNKSYANKNYCENFYNKINQLRKKYNFYNEELRIQNKTVTEMQLKLL